MLTRALVLFVVACSGGSSSIPDSSTADDAAAYARYPVVYTRWNEGPEIVAGNFEGEIIPLRALDGGVVLAGQTAVSPDGTRMAFTSFTRETSTWAVIVRPIRGTAADEVVLAQTIGGAARPAWSHDGTRIAYVSFTGEPFTYGVYVVEVTGGTPHLLGTAPSNATQAPCIAPQWSPDDSEIVFSTIYGLAKYVFAEERVEHLVPLGDAYWTCAPQWSPDGEALAFTWGGGGGQQGRIARIARTGGAVTSLAPILGGMGTGQVQWSRDGARVAFIDFDYDIAKATLRITDPAGGPPITLDDLASGVDAGHPTWSPDGTELLYTRFDFPNARTLLTRIRAEAGSSRVTLGLVGATLDGTYATWLATPVSGE